MSRSKPIVRLLSVLTVLVAVLAASVVFTIRRSFPQVSGTLSVPGLTTPVEVIRDRYGVPHIYAQNTDDLFRAQGYVHAQDRFWQMDFWRHTGRGRLSELFGKSLLESDRFLRGMGFERLVEQEIAELDPISKRILDAYSDGVNAYLSERRGSELSLEHGILIWTNRRYEPAPWNPVDSMVWGKVMAWDLGMNLWEETYRSRLLQNLSAEKVQALFPPYPSVNPFILPGSGDTNNAEAHSALPLVSGIDHLLTQLPVAHKQEKGIGSNNWVVAGNHTTTGKPVLANDPHLGVQMPSIWHQVHLQCMPVSDDCRLNVAGFSFAGVPGVVIGHNDRIAWGFTNVGPDVMDLYIEKLNPQNTSQYEVNGKWVNMKLVREEIKISDGTSEPFTIRYTRHGPVISDFSRSAKKINKTVTAQMPEKYAIALRWTALEPTTVFPAFWKMNLARNWSEFRAAAASFDVPSQNCVYADVDGNIGYQVPGRIPIRAKGDGTYPVPGWTDDYEWTGLIPFEELPSGFNPSQGYVATANNQVAGSDYPHFLAADWDYGWRARRIVEMIEQQKGRINPDAVRKMQRDAKNFNAVYLVPALLELTITDNRLNDARNLLTNWDYQQTANSSAAALFEVFWKNLLAETFHDDLPEDARPSGGSRTIEIVRQLLSKPDSSWWDNRKTTHIEKRDDIFRIAFGKAVTELEQEFGKDSSRWMWGDVHTVSFRNATFGESGISVLEMLFNRGPFRTGGGSAVVNATSWDASESYEVDSLPSMRMIIDLSNLNNSLAIHTTGQSGHPYHRHYIDMAGAWSKVEYNSMLWDRDQVEANAEATLLLSP